jgi:hypothetical protein
MALSVLVLRGHGKVAEDHHKDEDIPAAQSR